MYNSIFEEVKKDEKKKKEQMEKMVNEEENQHLLVPLDPLFELEKTELRREREQVYVNYSEEINEKIHNNLQITDNDEESKKVVFFHLENKFKLKKEVERIDNDSKCIKQFSKFFNDEVADIKDNLVKNHRLKEEYNKFLQKIKSNIEVQVRINQAYVEIQQDKPIPSLVEAILVNRTIIDQKNSQIQ